MIKLENNLEKKVFETIVEYNLIEPNDKIVVAVSGGPDSISLLNILNNFKNSKEEEVLKIMQNITICVAHVNHLIRKEAGEDEEYVKNYCNKNQIEFYSKSIDVHKVANNNKMSTEEAGRHVRYDFFEEVRKKTSSNKIAIAHNKNDKIETIIMNIIRGTGISGLKGIEAKKDNKYIRPLIESERYEIENYCEEEKLNPRIDKTNFENDYNRNKIRNIAIPYIRQEFNPNIIKTIDRLSKLVKEEDDYLNDKVENTYNNIVIKKDENEIVIDLKKFNNEEKLIQSRLILYVISKLFGSPKGIEKIHIQDIIKLCQNNIGNKFLTPNKNLKVLVKNHKILFIKQI